MFFAVVLCHLQYCTLLEGLETLLRRRTLYFTGCELQRLPHGSQIISKRVWAPSIPPLRLKASTRIHPKAKVVETCLRNVWVNKMKAAASTTSAYYTRIPPAFIRAHEHGKCLTLFGTCVVLMPFVYCSYLGMGECWGKQRSPSVLDRTGQQFRHRKINGKYWESGAHFRITSLLSLCPMRCCVP